MLKTPLRIVVGHARVLGGLTCGVIAFILLPQRFSALTRGIVAWDMACVLLLLLCASLFTLERSRSMAQDAAAQQEGEWTIFFLVVGATVASFAAILGEFSASKTASPDRRDLLIGLVGVTLLASWLVTHTLFAMRYAHEYYTLGANGKPDGGLDFPGATMPDYWDFFYFAIVLGMTFQVSDVQITSRKLRRLATLHGVLGFLYNTVILALSVNIGAGLL